MNNHKDLRIPTGPGDVLLYEYLKPLNLEISDLADMLNVDRNTASALIANKIPLTADMVSRLAKTFNTSVKFWLNLQKNSDNPR